MNESNIKIVPECLKTMTGWGHNTIYNVCDNTLMVIQWEFMDYAVCTLGMTIIIAIGLAVIFLLTAFGAGMIREVFNK